MSAHIDKEGNLIIKIKADGITNAANELIWRRSVLLDALVELDTKQFNGTDVPAGIAGLLQDTEPSFEQ